MSFSSGGAFSWASPVIPKLNGKVNPENNPLPEPLTTVEESWIASLISIGASIGPIIAGYLSEKIGRKKTLLAFSVPIIMSHLMCAFANNVHIFYIARILLGISIGCSFSVIPNYIGEIAEDNNRGLLFCVMPVMCNLGVLFNYAVGPFISIKMLSFISLVPMLLFVTLVGIFVPESPYYLAGIEDQTGVEDSLRKLRSKSESDIKKEALYISECVAETKKNQGSFTDLIQSRGLTRGLMITCGLMVFQQFSGINAVLAYMQSIFDATGMTLRPEYSSICIGVIQLFTIGLTAPLIDRLGRRILLLFSTIGSCLSLITLGLYFYLKNNGVEVNAISWLPIASLILFIVMFNLGIGPLPWTIMGELFPSNVKSMASTISSCTCMSLGFLISMFFPLLTESLGMAMSFWLFSACLGCGTIFITLTVPETKGRSLMEIQNLLNNEDKK